MIGGRYLAVRVGCLECGDPTDFHGPFDTVEEAQLALLFERDDDDPPPLDWMSPPMQWAGSQMLLVVDLEASEPVLWCN